MPSRTVKAAMVLAVLAFAATTLASCGGDSEGSAADGGAAAPDASADAPGEAAADSGEAATTCDLGADPPMPAITSEVVIEGDDGGAPPTPTGGDEVGLWAYTKITLYLPPQASGQIDPAQSKIEGKGYIEVDAGKFRQFVETTTVLSTATVGKVTRAGTTKVLGTYAKTATGINFTVTCRESTGEMASPSQIGFSRIDATRGRMHLQSMSQLGTANLVIDLQKVQ